MKNLSVAELEKLGVVIGKVFHDKYDGVIGEKAIDTMIEKRVTELLKKSNSRNFMFSGVQLNPLDIDVIEKSLYTPAGTDEVAKKLQDWNDDLYLLCQCTKQSPESLRSFKSFETKWSELAKALNTQTAGSGLEWVPTGFSSQMIEFVEIEAKVASLFNSFTMPTNPYTYPVLLADGTAYLGTEPTSDNPSMYKTSGAQTDNLSFNAVKLIANYPVTEEMQEDSVVPVLPQLRKSIARAMAKAEDNAIINGDTTATHFDTGYTVATEDARRAWKGLRRLVSDANTALGLKIDGSSWAGSTGLGLLRSIVEDMGVYGLDPADLAIILNTNMYNKFKSLDQVTTVDKFSNAATVKNGVLTGVDGIDFVKSQFVQEAQNDSGIYDATTVTDTQFLVVYKPAFWRGIRRNFTVELVRKPLQGMDYLVATTRRVWKPIYDTATQPVAGWLYNVTK
jgi:hypothetical protein